MPPPLVLLMVHVRILCNAVSPPVAPVNPANAVVPPIAPGISTAQIFVNVALVEASVIFMVRFVPS